MFKEIKYLFWNKKVNLNTYCPFLIGFRQTQWNFHPKSIYKSSPITWKISPVTNFPSGSPSCKKINYWINITCSAKKYLQYFMYKCEIYLHRRTWSCELGKQTFWVSPGLYHRCARTSRNFARNRSILPQTLLFPYFLSFLVAFLSRQRIPRSSSRCFLPLYFFPRLNIS